MKTITVPGTFLHIFHKKSAHPSGGFMPDKWPQFSADLWKNAKLPSGIEIVEIVDDSPVARNQCADALGRATYNFDERYWEVSPHLIRAGFVPE